MGRLHVETIQIDPALLRRTTDGAVLTPEKTVNIGTMDATLNRSGRTVVVQADEAIMVSVEYRPAFL